MHLRLRSSIVLVVVVGVLIPVSVSSYLTLGRRQEALVQRMQSDHERMTGILALGVQSSLWNFDPLGALPLVESLLDDRRIVTVDVRDATQKKFLFKQQAERRTGRQHTLVRNVMFNGSVIGDVRVEMDSGERDREIALDRRSFAWTVTGQLLLSLVLIVTLLQRRLLVPIGRLMRDSSRLAARDLATPFDWQEKDELGSLGASLERTRKALQGLFGEIEAKNLLMVQDIQRRALIEEELQQHRDHLEELVRERTCELQAAKERADLANQAKSTFLSSMTHELRTPLNAILGYAQILKRDKGLSERQKTGLNTIHQSGDHLLMLISDLLDLAKIEAGKFELVPEPINLQLFLTGIVNIVRVKSEQKDLLFNVEVVPDLPPTVMMDEKRLRQVLLNLLGNAVKFTDVGHISLKVSRVDATADETGLRFDVQDTGVGMEQSQLAAIFQPFEQVGDVQRKFGGTGLGLSISRQLVRLMGGDIAVASKPGAGSCFSFEIHVPLSAVEASTSTAERILVGYQGARKKVLIVDDVAANRDMLKDLMNSMGFDICLAENGLEGVEQAVAQRPDIILMDIMMPVMDGSEAIRRIRSTPGLEQVAIIAISASITEEDLLGTLSTGANVFMSKPVQQNLLLLKIGALLSLTPIYEISSDEVAVNDYDGALIAPPEDEMQALSLLAQTGNMRDIRLRADHIEALDTRYAAFAERLRQLARAYQSKAIAALVDTYAKQGDRE